MQCSEIANPFFIKGKGSFLSLNCQSCKFYSLKFQINLPTKVQLNPSNLIGKLAQKFKPKFFVTLKTVPNCNKKASIFGYVFVIYKQVY